MRVSPRLRWLWLLSIGMAALAGCGKGAPGPQAGGKEPPPPKVTVVKPTTYPVQKYFEYNGYLEAMATNEIRARVKGFLDAVHFKEGVEVEKGAPLYTIDPRQYAAAVAKSKADIAKAVADMASASAQITLAQANLDRFKASGSGASKSETDQAQATLESNKASYNVAAANKSAAEAALQSAELDLSYTDIKAPITGRISRTLVTQGNLVGQTEATLLTTIVSVDPIYVYFDTPEKDLVAYQQAGTDGKPMEQAVPIEIGIATEEGYPHRGILNFRDNKVDTGTGTIKLRASVPNPVVPPKNIRQLYPGLYTRIRVPNGPVKDQLTIPEEALMTGQEGRYVYVIGKDNTVTKRSVTVGANVWRMTKPDPKAPPVPGWSIENPNPAAPPPGPPDAPPMPPAPTKLTPRSIIAIESGLEPDDQVIIVGLQRAQMVQPGKPVTPDLWNLVPPPKK